MICGKGFGMILVLVWAMALSSDLTLVSGQTVAPKTSSTVAPPHLDEKPMIVNAPPMKQKKVAPAAPAAPAAGTKPLQVTGFITKTGNIYEIEDRRGSIGSIEGRQAVEEKRDADEIVCNYGNVVIYSDVPCDQVTSVRVGEIKQIKEDQSVAAPAEDTTEAGQGEEQQPAASEQQSQMTPQQGEEDSQLDEAESRPQVNHPRQQQNNNRRRRRRPQQQRQQMQQRRRRRQQQQLQQRRRNGFNNNNNNNVRRRRNRNGNNNLRRGQQQQRRRINNNNRRRINGNNNNNNNQRRRQQQQRRNDVANGMQLDKQEVIFNTTITLIKVTTILSLYRKEVNNDVAFTGVHTPGNPREVN
ncbi:hybrid signal transduction histidine kinase A [Drosophila serrata]|uniref:hybrid signal transduction histidine kinase A n=1 Tax=Drosophila serrata TaxID=7274 RepID=UPI000A1D19E7|nr:hybrid signal transduction histidine kinase A [Drosophila serrata]